MHAWHDIIPVDFDGCPAGRSQGPVKDGPVFGAVDFLAVEHRVDPLPQSGFLRESREEIKRLVSDAILRVMEINARRFGRKAPATLTVIGEQIPQMQGAGLLTLRFEAL